MVKGDPSGSILGQVSHLVWALAWSGDRDVNQFGNSDDWDTGVQDDAKNKILFSGHLVKTSHLSLVTKVITYSEAMLISGASKQISCAILYNYIFVFLVKK